MSPRQSAAAVLIVLAGGGLYCSLYNLLQGRLESPLVGAGWALANLAPWLAAFELAKRLGLLGQPMREAGWRLAALVAGTALLSLLLEAGLGLIAPAAAPDLAFELVRRLPGAALVLAAIVMLRMGHGRAAHRAAANDAELPLLAQQIDWIKAAGNYLEFHHGSGLVMRRMTLAQAEARLAAADFVRIHRSTIVNAARIVRIRRGKLADEVELAGGRRLKVGDAYRSGLAALERRLAA